MMRGIEHYTSQPGFHCIRLHYSADPAKDPSTPEGARWLENEIRGIPGGIASAQFRQEYEVDWDAAGGELCFPQFEVYKSNIVVKPFDVPETWKLYGSFDYGHRAPSSFHVYGLDYDNNIWVVWEYYKTGKGYKNIAKAIRECPYFNKLSFLPIADPQIWAKDQAKDSGDEMTSVAQLFFDLPEDERIMFAKGKHGGDVTVAEKINGDLWFVPESSDMPVGWKFEPKLRIFANCPMMIWELAKIRYADWSGTMQEQRNAKESVVDKDNHAFDDLKMFMTMFFMAPNRPESDPMEALKHEDFASYQEWKAVARLHDQEHTTKGTLGDFEDSDGDVDD